MSINQINQNTSSKLSLTHHLSMKKDDASLSYTFKLFDDLIDWAVKMQTIVLNFIIEIELLALLHDVKELVK